VQVQLHPKSVWEVPGTWRSSARLWDGYGDGRGVLASTEARDDLLDRLRFFAEECDAMQVPLGPTIGMRHRFCSGVGHRVSCSFFYPATDHSLCHCKLYHTSDLHR